MKIYKTAALESSDPTITVPDEVHIDDAGHAWAVHEGLEDIPYLTLGDLERHYKIAIPRD